MSLMNEPSRSLRRLRYSLDAHGLTDGQLLQRFSAHQNEAAFEVLMRRHAPMVLGVCRRILGNHHDAEDAFQATFLVLARKSASVSPVEMVASWLYGVAYRTARKAKAQAAKMHAREKSVAELPERGQGSPASLSDLEVRLDQELNRLPDKYRAPLILCELEGRTHKEVAQQLGWPEGTLSVRLMRAKKILANRLMGRNLGPAGGLLSALLCTQAATAHVPLVLVADTAETAVLFAAGQAAPAIPAKVLALADGVLKSMLLTKVKSLVAALVLVSFMGTGAAYSTQLFKAAAEIEGRAGLPNVVAPAKEQPRVERPVVANERLRPGAKEALPPGAIARIGTVAFRTGLVRGSAMSPDGRSLFINTPKGVHLHDLETGLPLRFFPTFGKPPGIVDALALSADGTVFAAGSRSSASLWDVKSGNQLRLLETTSLKNATFSPDGKKLVVDNSLRAPFGVRVLDVASGKEEFRLAEGQESISQIVLTTDGKTLITASQRAPSIHVIDFASKKLIHSLNVAGAVDPMVAVSPDSKSLFVADRRDAGVRKTCVMRFVDLASGQSRAIPDLLKVPVMMTLLRPTAALYSPDGGTVLVAATGTCYLIDAASGKATAQFKCGIAKEFHFTPDGRRLVVLDDNVIRVWDMTTFQELHPPEAPTEVAGRVALSPDGKIVASADRRSAIYCWSVATGKLLAKLDDEGFSPLGDVRNFSFAPDGRLIAGGKDGTIRVWETATFVEKARMEVPDRAKGAVNIASDGHTLASVVFPAPPGLNSGFLRREPDGQPARLFAWDIATGLLLRDHQVPIAMNRGLPALSPDGKAYLGPVGPDICLKDLFTDKELVKLKPNPKPPLPGVLDANFIDGPASFSSDGKTVALVVSQLRKEGKNTVAAGHQIVVFDLNSGKEQCRIKVAGAGPKSFALAPDGRRVASTTGASACIWDAATGQELWTLPEVGGEVAAVAFSADGNRLATALSDTTILVWDVGQTNRQEPRQP
jgi:RNA polymerase sigma factor (sigma-70 family)